MQDSGAFLPLSCRFQAPTFRRPRFGPADVAFWSIFRGPHLVWTKQILCFFWWHFVCVFIFVAFFWALRLGTFLHILALEKSSDTSCHHLDSCMTISSKNGSRLFVSTRSAEVLPHSHLLCTLQGRNRDAIHDRRTIHLSWTTNTVVNVCLQPVTTRRSRLLQVLRE